MRYLALAVTAATAAFLAPSARADTEIMFGGFSPAGCVASSNGTDEGRICGPSVNLTSGPDIFDIQAFSDHFLTPDDLTFKPGPGSSETPVNPAGESGFGNNPLGATSCTTDAVRCEILGNESVAISSNIGLVDAIVGSAQVGENFTVWAGNSLATLAPVATSAGGSCTSNGITDDCVVTFAAAKFVGLTSGGTGDVLLTGISVPTAEVPEPSTLATLLAALVSLGSILWLRRRQS